MARKRQMVLLKVGDPGDGGGSESGSGGLAPLGSVPGVIGLLAGYNTAPDGSGPEGRGDNAGMALLYGPGLLLELPTGMDEVAQAIITITDEDFAWPVLWRLCSQNGWRMMDPDTGRTFG